MPRPFDSLEQYDNQARADNAHVLDFLLANTQNKISQWPAVDIDSLNEMFEAIYDALRIEREVNNEWRYYLRKEIRRLREERSYDYV